MRILTLTFLFVAQTAWSQVGPKGMPAYSDVKVETNSANTPEQLEGVKIDMKLGASIDLNQYVINENGQKVQLSSFFSGHKPILLSPMYYNCPSLCNIHFNGVVETLKKMDWSVGNQFDVIAFSFDSKETPADAIKKKNMYMKMYNRTDSEKGFHFVVAEESVVQALMKSLGFQFKWNAVANEWSHASAAVVLTSAGIISRYLPGIDFSEQDMKLSLNEASDGKIGSLIDRAVLFCFKYDEHKSKYGLQVFRVVQLGGIITIGLLLLWLIPVFLRSGREKV